LSVAQRADSVECQVDVFVVLEPTLPKKKSPAEAETNWNLILTSLLVVLVLAVAMGFAYRQWVNSAPKPIQSTIRLNNQCGLIDEAFVATSTDGRRAEFSNGVAVLRTMSNERVFLSSSPKYPAFGFESPPTAVKENMTLTAQCSSVDRTIDALREQFQKK
jgi:hypothetical protein